MHSDEFELRCDGDTHRMFGKIRVVDNLIEFACRDCRNRLGAEQVFHYFALDGELVRTEVVRAEAEVEVR